ncbi:MAG: hypothetical protein WD382_04940 [Halofilum sp. (in: g-proteobacteria)]
MIEPLRRLAARLDAQSRRERVLLALALSVALLLAWDQGLRQPLAERHEVALDRVESARADAQRLESSTEQLRQRLADSGRGDEAASAIAERLVQVDQRLSQSTQRIIAPNEMVAVLRDVLSDEERLRLVALGNAGVEPLALEGLRAADAAGLPTIYRHRVELVVEGRYFALLRYLERLEGLDWRFQWDALKVITTEYPTARATLSLSTLSLAEDWIGV